MLLDITGIESRIIFRIVLIDSPAVFHISNHVINEILLYFKFASRSPSLLRLRDSGALRPLYAPPRLPFHLRTFSHEIRLSVRFWRASAHCRTIPPLYALTF
jgi:hypothetical protein